MSDPSVPSSSSALPTAGVRLKDRNGWPEWMTQLKFHALSKGVWKYVDPDRPSLGNLSELLPERPSYPPRPVTTAAVLNEDGTIKTPAVRGDPTEHSLKRYDARMAEWRIDYQEGMSRMARVGQLQNWVNATVDSGIMVPLMMAMSRGPDQSLHETVRELRAELAPNVAAMKEHSREKYRAHLAKAKRGGVTPEQWYRDWNALYMECKAYSIPEVEGMLASLDFLDALSQKLAPSWAGQMRSTMLADEACGDKVRTLHQLGIAFSALVQHQSLRSSRSPGVFATIGSEQGNQASSARASQSPGPAPIACPCKAPGQQRTHRWPPHACGMLLTAIGAPTEHAKDLTPSVIKAILTRLGQKLFKKAREQLVSKGFKIPPASSGELADKEEFSAGVCAALLDPRLAPKHLGYTPGAYSTMDFQAHWLSMSTILDNGAAVHLVNSASLLEPDSFTPVKGLHTVEAGTQAFPITGYGKRVFKGFVTLRSGRKVDLKLSDVAVVEGFHLNIVSEARLHEVGLWYLGLDSTLRMGPFEKSSVAATLQREMNLTFMQYKPPSSYEAPVMNVMRSSQATHPRTDSADLWHARLGHLGARALEAAVSRARGVRIKGPARLQCEACALTHAKQVISRRPKERSPRPFWRISWDLFDMSQGLSGEQWILLIKDEYSGKIFLYLLQNKGIDELMRAFYEFESMVYNKYKLRIVKIGSDNDPSTAPWRGTSQYQAWAKERGIELEPAPAYTHEPNGAPERAGQEIITKQIKMREGANLPEHLWTEASLAAAWLYNMSPSYAHELRSPNETLDEWFRGYFRWYQPELVRNASADLRPNWSGVYAYGCRAYPLNKDRAAGRRVKSFKTLPRGHIGYLVGYRASNLYRIWVPRLNEVFTTRNVTFNEELFYENKEQELPKEDAQVIVDLLWEDESVDTGEALDELLRTHQPSAAVDTAPTADQTDEQLEGPSGDRLDDSAIARADPWAGETRRIRAGRSDRAAELLSPEATPEPEATSITEELLSDRRADRDDSQGAAPGGMRSSEAQGARSPEADGYPSPASTTQAEGATPAPSAEPDAPRARVRRPRIDYGPPTRRSERRKGGDRDRDPSGGLGGAGVHMLLYDPEQFSDLETYHSSPVQLSTRAFTTLHSVVAAALAQKPTPGKVHWDNLPAAPKLWKELANHPYGAQFIEAAKAEIQTQIAAETWRVVDRASARGRPLPLKWVFTYKCDEDGYLIKVKARLVVRGDLQAKDSLHSTYAATLAARSFRLAMAIAAEFDMEIWQLDVVAAFLNAHTDSDRPVWCDLPDGFGEPGMCALLNKALYGMRDSPLLWYTDFSTTLTKLGLTASKEEPCLFFNAARRVLVLFYVDDILLLFAKSHRAEATELLAKLKGAYKLDDKGDVNWFLGVRVVRERSAGTVSLLHDTYLDKVAKRFNLAETGRFPETPLPVAELVRHEGEASKQDIKAYQERVGSVLYSAIMIRPDVAYAVSQLSQFLTNPSQAHMDAVEHLIVYLYRSRHEGITYGGGVRQGDELQIYGDASFADNAETRRSSHGFIVTLFGGPIIWKAARQPTVTTSTTEAELLALEQIAKETMALKRLFAELQLLVTGAWTIFCDNQQTIRLVVGHNERISTKLRHVDIQNMWLRQEHGKGSFEVLYKPTLEMLADGLTKHLPKLKFKAFKEQLNLRRVEHHDITETAKEHGKDQRQA
jgi:hypothetical protein